MQAIALSIPISFPPVSILLFSFSFPRQAFSEHLRCLCVLKLKTRLTPFCFPDGFLPSASLDPLFEDFVGEPYSTTRIPRSFFIQFSDPKFFSSPLVFSCKMCYTEKHKQMFDWSSMKISGTRILIFRCFLFLFHPTCTIL